MIKIFSLSVKLVIPYYRLFFNELQEKKRKKAGIFYILQIDPTRFFEFLQIGLIVRPPGGGFSHSQFKIL